MSENDYLLLKWGTLKGWKLSDPTCLELMQKYINIGASYSCMTQKDTDEQKDIICELIRNFNGPITNDWSGDSYTKDEAIEYVTDYGKEDAA